ncbi:MAG: UPF0158 family protein [Selenomonas sp.]|uniref:UPF0158 family protein n=1 Tax=Selenomonas sp. TaxID=2053611 RepID=UPI0025EBEC88|nr:UPF0158 family protein [Selenomonas sp.]MCI6100675.1 UPF0158 family protein [Selenomonas sp.]MCI6231177.1 UPF0158 family protein [Selenomonas sp.]
MNIRLADLAAAIARSDVVTSYIDTAEGRVLTLEAGDGGDAAFDHAMRIEEDFERYIPLPDLYDAEEPRAMQAFADAQSPETRDRLASILATPGAAPRFRREVRHLLLEKKWQAFLHSHLLVVAKDFCEENGIGYDV